ncbi:hypothetical protein AMES_3747 [Amycolatopsis mediterranei S699]|uniref:Uncharacterized protein n=2 Tax=Amycolatopsis mediterranei TaxID=33910 RepID=A0A0H3D4H1_AMYMU|nr:DUF6084 family protein [Amycolatopsis mediterranei]ADJ45571.1 conserved hypothetical protein [Amycolatopsis mediterranei U32]AEK42347.1 hypothetical protein RAM_19305 [Amycolatopsis mediterranei S699]AFO77283.1 hypothetical protein AMES_3747 [Amycolatopsis mediterranei S699]AGT84411.1 hypothetical protein B737_3747 [Amycolatopsis mediterranei RB]KDO05829.1 hypothetical protein DV26_36315 [Amycolatopsis mediterranei]
MAELTFDCIDVRPLKYAASPTLAFKLRISELTGQPVHAMVLRVQIRIEPQRRRYADDESELLTHLFGDRSRWGETLKPFQFTSVSVTVPGFSGATEVDVEVPCTYDLEVAAGKYFHALSEGVVPMVLLFSGTVFGKGGPGFWVEQVPWHTQAECRMPVTVWDELMSRYFPNAGWIKLPHETLDALLKYKAEHAIPTWEAAIERLLAGGS